MLHSKTVFPKYLTGRVYNDVNTNKIMISRVSWRKFNNELPGTPIVFSSNQMNELLDFLNTQGFKTVIKRTVKTTEKNNAGECENKVNQTFDFTVKNTVTGETIIVNSSGIVLALDFLNITDLLNVFFTK